MTALDKLIAAVEAGTAKAYDFAKSLPAKPPVYGFSPEAFLAQDAYNGDLNAALRLHEALLPGWVWCPEISTSGPCEGYMSPPLSSDGINVAAENPARAWLLAILRAAP